MTLEIDRGDELNLVGHTITRFLFFDNKEHEWGHHGQYWLWLDDGRVIEFSSTGYDADSPTMEEIEVMDVEECLHCKEPHPASRVSTADEGFEITSWGLQPREKYTWCSNGHNYSYRSSFVPNERSAASGNALGDTQTAATDYRHSA